MHLRSLLLATLLSVLSAAVAAQAAPAPPLVQETQQTEGRKNQKVERIHVEDGGARIDELRYAGQTENITVQPKADVPAYEIQPSHMSRSRPGDHRDGMSNATGQRVWNVFKF